MVRQEVAEWRSFTEWLIEICKAAGIIKYGDLHWLLARVNYRCDPTTVRKWLRNETTPSVDAIPYLLKAITEHEPEFDVYAEYDNYLHQRASTLDVRQPSLTILSNVA